MTSQQRLERDLPQILGDLAMGPYPDYIDDVLAKTAQRRQRPAWTFPERWLPMVDIARQPVLAPRVPWRTVGLALALFALLLVAVGVFVGTQPRLPAPFGVARNGLIAFAEDGDIHTLDPITGVTAAVVTGPGTDLVPEFSLDGTRIVFERKVTGDSGPGRLYVARANGSDPMLVTPEPLASIESYAFSPDGREILVSAPLEEGSGIFIASSDGTAMRRVPLPEGLVASELQYRPPTGQEILFVGDTGGPASGLYTVELDGRGLRTIVEPSGFILAQPRWSPDGSTIAYTSAAVDWATGGQLLRVNIVSADGQTGRLLRPHPEADTESDPYWSNDGTRLLISRCLSSDGNILDGICASSYAVVPMTGNGFGVSIDVTGSPAFTDSTSWWAPDDRSIVTIGNTPVSRSTLWDPLTGRSETPAWTATGDISWQRRAP